MSKKKRKSIDDLTFGELEELEKSALKGDLLAKETLSNLEGYEEWKESMASLSQSILNAASVIEPISQGLLNSLINQAGLLSSGTAMQRALYDPIRQLAEESKGFVERIGESISGIVNSQDLFRLSDETIGTLGKLAIEGSKLDEFGGIGASIIQGLSPFQGLEDFTMEKGLLADFQNPENVRFPPEVFVLAPTDERRMVEEIQQSNKLQKEILIELKKLNENLVNSASKNNLKPDIENSQNNHLAKPRSITQAMADVLQKLTAQSGNDKAGGILVQAYKTTGDWNFLDEYSLDHILSVKDRESNLYTLLFNACVDILNRKENHDFDREVICTFYNVDGDVRFRDFDHIPRDEFLLMLAEELLQLLKLYAESPGVKALKGVSLGRFKDWLPQERRRILDDISKLKLGDTALLIKLQDYLKQYPGVNKKELYSSNKETKAAYDADKFLQRKGKPVILQTKPAGRKVDPCNPEAWQIIIDGSASDEAYKKAFTYWCNAKGIKPESASRNDRDAFKKAMNRQEKRSGQN